MQKHKPIVWLRYTDDVVFIWTHGKEKFSLFSEDLNKFHATSNFLMRLMRKAFIF